VPKSSVFLRFSIAIKCSTKIWEKIVRFPYMVQVLGSPQCKRMFKIFYFWILNMVKSSCGWSSLWLHHKIANKKNCAE
jgi:hypothetical protein